MHHSNELFESSALVALHEAERQQEIAHRRRILTARAVIRWPGRVLYWILVAPVRVLYRRVRRTRAPRRGWSAGRERSSFLGRPGVTREAKGLKPADPEVAKLRAQLDEFRTANVELHAMAAAVHTPTVVEEQATRDRGPLCDAMFCVSRAVVKDDVIGGSKQQWCPAHEGPGSMASTVARVVEPGSVPIWSRTIRDKPTGPTSDEAREATRLLQQQRQRKTEAEDLADRERHLREGAEAQANEELQFVDYIKRYEAQARARNKGKQ